MAESQSNFFAKLGRTITPGSNRAEPVVWFRELRILRKLIPNQSHDDPNEVRRVELRRGLNIVWAPPEESEIPELYGDGLSGHASGKTLFCRILRYLLGEEFYGPKSLRDAVADRFRDGLWAVAEVVVEKQPWTVARPLSGGSHRFACKGVSIDEVLAEAVPRGSHDDFLAAVSEAACGSVLTEAEGEIQFNWRYLMPWLARDQESRFSGLTEWRNSLAESENPKTSTNDQLELIKAVLGLLQPEEIRLRAKLHETEEIIRHCNEKLPEQIREAERDYSKLIEGLRRGGMKDFTGEESVTDLKDRLRQRREGITMFLDEVEKDENFVAAKTAWDSAVAEKNQIEGQLTQARKSLEDTRTALAEQTIRRQELQAEGMDDPSRYEDNMCPMTLGYAIKKRCVNPPPGASLDTESNLGEILLKANELERLEAKQKQQLTDLEAKLDQLDQVVSVKSGFYEAEKKRIIKATTEQRQWLRHLDAAKPTANEAYSGEATVAATRKQLLIAENSRDELKESLAPLRLGHVETERRLSNAFADIVRAAMGGKVEPSVKATDRGFTLSVKRNAELSGAALETIKILSFDLAAMVLSMEGLGHHPRFLIHDGPREADLARLIYERFFLYARKMEECCGQPDSANFQYIITTTTAPPKAMQDPTKWLRMTLDTAKAKERFLREDL